MDDREKPEQRSILSRRSLLASAALHGLVALILVLIALFSFAPLPEEPPLRVTLLQEGPGAAGAAGGARGGGGEQAATTGTPSGDGVDADAPAPQDLTTAVAVAVAPAPTPPPPKPSRPHHKPPPRRVAKTPTPIPQPPQFAQAPVPQPVEATPGAGNGLGDAVGTGTGAVGAGHGAVGDGPIDGPGDDYLDRLKRWLSRYKRYPEAAEQRKQRGSLVVSFTILRDGTVIDPQIEQSSGFPLLDEAAIQMLRDASPVPPLPESYRADRLGIDLPVDYKIGLLQGLF
jgi:protein TonB